MHPPNSLKHRFHQMLYSQHLNERWASVFNLCLATLILLNVLAMMFETMDALYREWHVFFIAFELASITLFGLEYLLRLWVANLTPKYQHPLGGRLRYMLTPMALIDLMAILPSIVFFGSADLRFLRAVRLFRVVRLLHLPHFNKAMHTIWLAAKSKRAEFMVAGIIMLVLLIICSSLVYLAEHGAQPKEFSSIPAALWWGMMTLTTVGYGDVYPITPLGKLFAAFFSALGIGFFALPSAILASALIEQSREKTKTCPHCGGNLKD